MSVTNLQLNVRANTARALSDFKKFSDTLDNKFLISGLKLDVIRSALSQINKEFQKSIGEQGLASASSLRAAQNQAAMLTQIFKGFSEDASSSITTNISTALNNVAVRAGGTMKDVQKTLSITPFLDRNISESARTQISQSVLEFQKNFRRAGMGDNFADVVGQFLKGEATGRDLANTGSPLGSFLGTQIMQKAGGVGFVDTPQRRTAIIEEILSDPQTLNSLRRMAKSASGYTIILEDLSTKLFNTESGVFGSLRKIALKGGEYTTIFDEVEKLVQSVFGPNGSFSSLFKSISEIFGIGDPLRPLVSAMRFFTKISDDLSAFFKSDRFKGILGQVKLVFDELWQIFKDVYQWVEKSSRELRQNISQFSFEKIFDVFRDFFFQIKTGNLDPSKTVEFIKEIGESVRGYIRKIGEFLRNQNIGRETDFVTEIVGTLLTEAGKTAIVLIKELFATLITQVPTIITSVLPAINNGINSLLTEAFGEVGGKVVKFIAGFLPGPVGAIARASAVGDVTGGGGSMLSALLMGGGALLAPALLPGVARLGMGLSSSAGRFSLLNAFAGRVGGAEGRINRMFGLVDPLTGDNRFNLLSRALVDPLSRRIRPSSATGVFPERFANRIGGQLPLNLSSPINPVGRLDVSDLPLFNLEANRRIPPTPKALQNLALSQFGLSPFMSTIPMGTQQQMLTNISNTGITEYQNRIRRLSRRSLSQGARFRIKGTLPENYAVEEWLDALTGQEGAFAGEQDKASRMIDSSQFDYNERVRERYERRRKSGSLRNMSIRNKMRRFGKGALIVGGIAGLGAIFNAGGAQASQTQFNPETGEMELVPQRPSTGEKVMSSLSGGMEGAMLGATIGSVVPGIGTAAGAVIGGIIGGIAPLINKEVLKSVGEFGSRLLIGLTTAGSNFIKFVGDSFNRIGNGISTLWRNLTRAWEDLKNAMSNGAKNLANGFIGIVNQVISTFTLLPRTIISVVKNLVEKIPGANLLPGVKEGLEAAENVANFQIGGFYKGRNNLSTVLNREAMFSGSKAMVVNKDEYVFPKGGLAPLANALAERVKSTSSEGVSGRNQPFYVQVNLTVNSNSVVADPSQLVNALRAPVTQIIDDAFVEARQKQLIFHRQ